MYANHNRCAEQARADWLVYLHSDDELTPTCLETLGRLIRGEDQLPAAIYEFHPYPVYETVLADPSAALIRAPRDTGLAMHFLVTPWAPPSGACYRADFLRRRPFDEHYLDADVLIADLALLDGEALVFTREPLVRKLDHVASCTSQSRQTAIYHFTYARTFRIVTEHPGWPRIQAELRSVIRRYPLYNQGSMIHVLMAAGRGRLARDLLPHVAKRALVSRAGLHTLGIVLLGEHYWKLLPGYTEFKNKLRATLRRGGRPTATPGGASRPRPEALDS
jgi:hypothetical protein